MHTEATTGSKLGFAKYKLPDSDLIVTRRHYCLVVNNS